MIAAGLGDHEGSPFDITDPEVGELKFYKMHWDADYSLEMHFDEIETRPCTA